MSQQAKTVAVKLLSRREHSVAELRQKLRARDFDEQEISDALLRLQEIGLQDDGRFCEMYIRQHGQRFGDFRLRAELERRGVAADDVGAALAAANLPSEVERATAVLRLKYPSGMNSGEEGNVDTARRFLYNRGFSGESIRLAIAALHTAFADSAGNTPVK